MNNVISMKKFKSTSLLFLLIILFSSCSSAQKLQSEAPIKYGEVYCETWVAGVRGGGSGINLFIPLSKEAPKSVQLDSVYFRGKGTLLEKIEGEKTLYVGRFQTNFNQMQDIVMSSDPNEEYGNEAPNLDEKIPFELKDSECVVSYKNGDETKYFKIVNVIEKQPQHYPSAPPNKQ